MELSPVNPIFKIHILDATFIARKLKKIVDW
jgi:hypothetical protein